MTVKINNKTYTVPDLGFQHIKTFEDFGLPMEKLLSRDKFMTALSAFVGVVVGCDEDSANQLMEQHVLGGGDIGSIYETYVKALDASAFFSKLLSEEEPKKKPGRKPAAKTETE